MSRQRFIELATDLCALAQLQEPERLLEGNAIEVNGVDFYLGYDEETAPGQLVVYCDFGAPPKERLLDVYEALLEANMVVYGNNSPAFMLSPDKRVAFGYQYELGKVMPQQLMGLFVNLAEQAVDWRSSYFLSN